MKKTIYYTSDLHLEFGGIDYIPSGNLLILAGDIFVIVNFKKKFKHIIEKICKNFDDVIMVCGNHEYYHGELTEKYRNIVKTNTPDNFHLLEDDKFKYYGVDILGSTLWTDFNNEDPIALYNAQRTMNDYTVIKNLKPTDTLRIHKNSVEFLHDNISKDNKTIIITHHCPIVEFAGSKGDFSCYASDQREFIEKNKNITHWIYGHTHFPIDEKVHNTRILSNPRGYIGFEKEARLFRFDKYFEIEV